MTAPYKLISFISYLRYHNKFRLNIIINHTEYRNAFIAHQKRLIMIELLNESIKGCIHFPHEYVWNWKWKFIYIMIVDLSLKLLLIWIHVTYTDILPNHSVWRDSDDNKKMLTIEHEISSFLSILSNAIVFWATF